MKKNPNNYISISIGKITIISSFILFFLGSYSTAIDLDSNNIARYCQPGRSSCQLNNISSIATDTFINHSSLQNLVFYGGQLASLPVGVFSGLTILQSLAITSNQLTTLPVGVFSGLNNLSVLQLGDTSITTLPVGVFNGLTNLESLYINNNLLTTLPVGIFSGLNNLGQLYLFNNLFTTIPSGIFSGLNNLRRLFLQNNLLTTLPVGVFSGLPALTSLNIGSNPITNITQSLFDPLTGLSDLQIHAMCISNPITITGLFGSQTIASDGCARITGTTTAAYENDLYNVGYGWNGGFMQGYIPLMFDAGQNTIRSNTRMISNGSTVYIDYPANTVITTNGSAYTGVLILPIDLGTRFANTLNNIKSAIKFGSPTQSIVFSQPVNVNISLQNATPWGIVEIYTSNNGTDRTLHTTTIVQQNYLLNPVLPFVSFDTTHATYFAVVEKPGIALNSTNITQEPFNCPILATECYLQSKNIGSIATDTFINHPNLQQLYISNNLLSDISIGAFNGLNNLTGLFLYDNLLTTLPVGVFSSLNSLQELDIYQNQLTSLSVGVFSGLNSLGHLQLGWNKITTLPVGVFSGLNNLQQLYLYDNLLTTLPVGVFNGLNSLEGLYMGSNLLNLSIGVFNGLSSLRRLFIEDNKMTNIPVGVFSGLNSLQELYLSNNYFTSFPSGLFDGLIDLSILHIGSNPITNITQSLFDPLINLYNLEMNDICIPDPITITLAFGSTTTNNNGCARITGTTAATYESNLYNRLYSLNGSFMEGWIPLSFNAGQNTIRSNTRMGFSSIGDLHVEYPANTVITTNGLAYTGILLPPRSLSTGFAKNISNVKSFIKFGSPTQSITFSQPVTVYMPTPNINIGENVEIYSSNNAENRTFHTTEIVGDFNGSPFVIFDTTHATYFAIGENGGGGGGQTGGGGGQSGSGLVFMTFDVEAGNISCIYGNFNLGTTGTSFASQVLTATSSSTRECIDMKGTNNNPIQLTMAVPITNGTTTIPASNTLIRTTNPSDICDSGVMVTPNFTPLSSSVDLMRKNDPLDICMYTSMPELQVTLPAKATQGTYNGSLTVTFPS